jgi:hypothetical protein
MAKDCFAQSSEGVVEAPSPVFVLAKAHKRLWVKNTTTGELVYTPPDFINVVSRSNFDGLLADLNSGVRTIEAIMRFERTARRSSGFNPL